MLRDISPSLISFTKQPAGIVLTSWRVFGHIYGVLLNNNERFWNGLVWLCSVSLFLPCFLDTADKFDIWNLFRQKSKLPDCYFIHFFFLDTFLKHPIDLPAMRVAVKDDFQSVLYIENRIQWNPVDCVRY